MYKFKFADIGEGLHEGVVGDIYVTVGQTVSEGDSLFSVETDKVASDIPSPVSGVIKQIMFAKGDTIHVGQEIFAIDDNSGDDVPAKTTVEEPKTAVSQGSKSEYVFKFADIGEGLHEGVVGDIYVSVGQTVNEGDSLFSVETDKVASDIPSPVSGVIKQINFKQGETIHVGQEIFTFEVLGGSEQAPTKEEPKEEEKCLVGDAPNSSELIDISFNSSTPTKQEVSSVVQPAQNIELGKQSNAKIDEEFDVIVVGSGPGGYLAAEETGKSGLKTLIIEKEFWGGVCLNIGCIPTKAMLKSVDVLEHVKHANDYGIEANFADLKIDKDATWSKMHARKDKVVKQISGSVKTLMLSSKCKIEEGTAEFLGSHVIKVNGKVYHGKDIIIATGSHSRKLKNVEGFENGYKKGIMITSREAINYDKCLPKSMVIMGAGVIGVEFAQLFSSAGTKVTILQREDRILPTLDKDISAELAKKLTSSNVDIIYNTAIEKLNEKDELVYKIGDKVNVIKADLYLVAVGRIPATESIDQIGLNIDSRGSVVVDEHMRTNLQGVYAIGDVTGQNLLAHVAYQHALVAVADILGHHNIQYKKNKPVPGCIYTNPEIATIGLTEQEAKEQGYNCFTSKYLFAYLGKAIAANETTGFVKLIVDKEFGQILGAHIVGANATDYIAEIALAMEMETTVKELTYTIHPHPTFSEIVWEAARSAALKLELEHKK
ncbi:dihydrolipoyl dehydrogenase [Mycoplasmopsis felifaucium]|uniref:dihydrolipoyl dehydrogenase n=1 Tax=Mycoplasmopsis felifaucium TaxID=35768 RepID=UPI00056311F3|nr:dihydrolipoyl dehydrogenase [Mycoplasmopsis felifaucium]